MNGRSEDWDELFLRYLGGEADSELEQRVRARLMSDPSSRERLVTLACQQQAMAEVLSDSSAHKSGSRRSVVPPPGRRSGLRFFLAAAAAASLLVGVFLLRRTEPETTIRRQKPPSVAPEARTPKQAAPIEEPKKGAAPEEPPKPRGPAVPEPEPPVPPPAPKSVEKEPEPAKPEDSKPAPPAPKPETPSRPGTETVVAVVDRVEGDVTVISPDSRAVVAAKRPILAGQSLETAAAGSSAEISYPDGTRIRLEPGTLLRDIADGDKKGKRAFLARGALWASVRKQPADQPMVVTTPNGEARVLGTKFRLVVDGDNASRLEVEEGKVRLKRLLDGKTIDVTTGHFAVAATGTDLKPLPWILLGLVGSWRFEEPAGTAVTDGSSQANHGQIAGNLRRVLGKSGLALELDGAGVVSIPHSASLDPGLSAWSVAAWVRKSDDNVQSTVVFKDDGNFRSYYFLVVLAKPRFEIGTGDGKVSVEAKTSCNEGKWHHVVAVRSAAYALQIYVDGVLEGSASIPPTAIASIHTTSPLKIGNATPSGLGPWKGSLDEVRIYNRALSAEDVRQLYQGR